MPWEALRPTPTAATAGSAPASVVEPSAAIRAPARGESPRSPRAWLRTGMSAFATYPPGPAPGPGSLRASPRPDWASSGPAAILPSELAVQKGPDTPLSCFAQGCSAATPPPTAPIQGGPDRP